tara:strand:+ start:1458 stop:1973 length:516 start_codon:yes stop_codon:yes gene_type:complete
MKMKIFYILILFSYGCHSQENWTLYPNKDSINSINKIDTILNQKKIDSSGLLNSDKNNLSYINNKGSLVEHKDPRIDSLNNYISKHGKYNSFTVQLYVSQNNDEIRNYRKKFIRNFPEMEIFDEYIAPNIFLYSGLFQDYNQATLYKKELDIIFKNTLVVRKKVPHQIEKK